ncbi:MAG: PP2C family protein-serine/threonine phosphatase, partial [Gemmata sp.]
VMVIDPAKHTLTVVNAGHISPKLYRGATDTLVDAVSLDDTGLPIGAMPGYPFAQVTLSLAVGDAVAVYTDGVTDAMNAAEEMFGQDAVDRCLAPPDPEVGDTQRPCTLGERLVSAVRRHANGRPQNDDIAVVTFGRLEPGTGPHTSANRLAAAAHKAVPGSA